MPKHAGFAGMVLLSVAVATLSWWARGALPAGPAPRDEALYLTWTADPSTTMTVAWLCDDAGAPAPAVFFRAGAESVWRLAGGARAPFPHTDWMLCRAELTGLQPGTEHEFVVAGRGRVHRFRTLPATLEAPLRFAQGGDVAQDFGVFDRMNARAAALDPAFVVWGGDLAYCDGQPDKAGRWWHFFSSVHRHLRAPDGRLIPVVTAPGNHERRKVGGGEEQPAETANCYLAAFPPRDGRTYSVLDAGDYLSLVLLDSGHFAAIEGAQTRWLADVLAARRSRPHVLPVYHVAAYPSVRDFETGGAAAIRAHWVPLFEHHPVRLAFEHHDHAFKVTHPIRAGRVDPAGVVYIGDGAWGANVRAVHPSAWYLARAAPLHHFHEVTLEPGSRTVRSLALDGSEVHRLEQSVTAR